MLVEFTSVQNKPVFVNVTEVAGIEQQKKNCSIYLNSGIKLVVKESAAEIYKDLNNATIEKLLTDTLEHTIGEE